MHEVNGCGGGDGFSEVLLLTLVLILHKQIGDMSLHSNVLNYFAEFQVCELQSRLCRTIEKS